MMINEFMERVNAIDNKIKVTNAQYETIEMVYTFYPGMGNKDDTAEMYVKFGIIIFNDMLPRAKAFADIQTQIQRNKMELELIKNTEKELYK